MKGTTALALAGWLWCAHSARAEVERIHLSAREPFAESAVGPYVKITGTFVASLDPLVEAIPGLDRAPRRPDGRVEYTSDFIILAPASAEAGNRVLLVDVENNGRPVVHGLYNSPTEGLARQLELGNAFLEDHGFIVAITSWQDSHGITLPRIRTGDDTAVPLHAVGFAAVRDFGAFLRFAVHDEAGVPNPIAGRTDIAVAAGSSQTGRFLKSFLHHGFNRAGTRTVFDALHLHVAQAGTLPFLAPPRADPRVVKEAVTGDNAVYPFTYADVLAPLAGRGERAPRMLATNVEGDYYRRQLSLLRTGPAGDTDIRLPENVRVWDIAGGSHGIVLDDGCAMPRANLDWHPVLRAGLLGLVEWARGGPPLPESRLLPLERAREAPYVKPPPGDQPGARLMTPRRDQDDNAVAGLRLPTVAVPLGTFGGWNAPLDTNCGDQSVFWHPFPRTALQRIMTRDSRASLQERYRTQGEYIRQVQETARRLVQEGYLLGADAVAITAVAKARAQPLLPPSPR